MSKTRLQVNSKAEFGSSDTSDPTGAPLLVDREQELQTMITLLSHGESIGLIGPRRIGKTLVARMLVELLNRTSIVSSRDLLRFDARSVAGLRGLEPGKISGTYESLEGLELEQSSFLGLLLRAVMRGPGPWSEPLKLRTRPKLEFFTFEDSLAEIHKILAKSKHRFVVVLDEFDRVYGSSESELILSALRRIVQQFPWFSFVLVGTDVVYSSDAEIGSPLGNVVKWVRLGLLPHTAALKLMESCLTTKIQMTPAATDRLLKLTGDHPYLIISMANKLLRDLSDGNIELDADDQTGSYRLTASDVGRLREDERIAEFLDGVQVVFDHSYDRLESAQRQMLHFLARNSRASSRELALQVERVDPVADPTPLIWNLKRQRLVLEGPSDEYSLESDAWAFWLKKYRIPPTDLS